VKNLSWDQCHSNFYWLHGDL